MNDGEAKIRRPPLQGGGLLLSGFLRKPSAPFLERKGAKNVWRRPAASPAKGGAVRKPKAKIFARLFQKAAGRRPGLLFSFPR